MSDGNAERPEAPRSSGTDPSRMDALTAAKAPWRKHGLDVRISIPFLTQRFYLTIVGGRDRRGMERRKSDRSRTVLLTGANLAFFVILLAWAAVVLWIGAQPFLLFLEKFVLP